MAVDIEQTILFTNMRRYLELKLRMAAARQIIEASEQQIAEDEMEVARLVTNLATNFVELAPDIASAVRQRQP